MKAIHISLLIAAGLLSSGTSLADDALAKTKGCLACHTVDKKLIGPTYKEVAQEYAGQKDAETRVANTILKGTPSPAGARQLGRHCLRSPAPAPCSGPRAEST